MFDILFGGEHNYFCTSSSAWCSNILQCTNDKTNMDKTILYAAQCLILRKCVSEALSVEWKVLWEIGLLHVDYSEQDNDYIVQYFRNEK